MAKECEGCEEITCQECCTHDDDDHGICLDCELDMTDILVARSEAYLDYINER